MNDAQQTIVLKDSGSALKNGDIPLTAETAALPGSTSE